MLYVSPNQNFKNFCYFLFIWQCTIYFPTFCFLSHKKLHGHFNIILKTTLEGYLNTIDPIITIFYTLTTKTMTNPIRWWTSITSRISSLMYHWFSLMMTMLLFGLRVFTMGCNIWRTFSFLHSCVLGLGLIFLLSMLVQNPHLSLLKSMCIVLLAG